MFTDPLLIVNGLASVKTLESSSEKNFALISSDPGSSVRVWTDGNRRDVITVKSTTSNENSKIGLTTDRILVRYDVTAKAADGTLPGPETGSVQMVIAAPRSGEVFDPALILSMICGLVGFVTTNVDDPASDADLTVDTARILRLLAGEG